MAASSKNTVSLVIEAGVTGEENVRRFADEVRRLARDGGDAAPQFQALAVELDKIGNNAATIASLKALGTEVATLTERQTAAAAAAAKVGAALKLAAETADPLRSKQEDLNKSLANNKNQLDLVKNAIEAYRGGLRLQGEDETAAALRLAGLIKERQKYKDAISNEKKALADLKGEVDAAVQSESKLAGQYDTLSVKARDAANAVAQGVKALQSVEAVALAAGVATADLAAADQALLTATQRIAVETQRLTTLRLEQAESDKLAAATAAGMEAQFVKGRAALLAEIAATNEATAAARRYDAAKASESSARASAEALHFVEVLEREALAQDRATRGELERQAALTSTAERTKRRAEIEQTFVTALNAADVAATEATASMKRLADSEEAISKAFGQAGVRSLQAIQTEINGVKSSLGLLNTQYKAGEITVQDYARAVSSAEVRVATLRRELQTIPSLPNVFEKLNSSIQDTIGRFGALTAALATVGFVAKPILDANFALESMRKTLTFVTGSASEADKQIQFLQVTADRAGLSFGALARDFALFEASVIKSGIPLGVAQDLFQGVAAAAGKLGISSERTSNILLALGQVANKGKVSLEELQGQIGEALPGALKIAADSLGVTTAQMSKMLKDGTLLASEFLPLFGRQLIKTFDDGSKSALTLEQAFARVQNAFRRTSQELSDTAAYRGLISVTDAIARNFDTLVTAAGSLTKAFLLFKAIDIGREFFGLKVAAEAAAAGKKIDAAASLDGAKSAEIQKIAVADATLAINVQTAALERNALAQRAAAGAALGGAAGSVAAGAAGAAGVGVTVAAALATGAGKVTGAIGNILAAGRGLLAFVGGPVGLAVGVAITFSDQIEKAFVRLYGAVTGVTKQYEANEKALKDLADREAKAAEEARIAAGEKNKAAVQLKAAYGDLFIAAEKATHTSRKYAEAVKAEGDASVKLAELIGDQGQARVVAASSALKSVSAQQALATATERELTLTTDLRDGLVRLAGGYEKLNVEQKKQVDDYTADVDKLKAVDELAKAHLESLRNEAAQTYIAAEATRDNSGRLAELNEERKHAIALAGTDADSQRRVAIAAGLYADALKDAIRNTQQKNEVEKADLTTREAGLRVSNDQAKASATIAALLGDESKGLQALLVQKKNEIEQTQLLSDRKKADAEYQVKSLTLQKEEIVGTDDIAIAKRKELDLRIQNEKAKIAETESTPALVKALGEERKAIELRLVLQQRQSDLRVASVQADNNITQASIAVQQQRLKVDADVATSQGNSIVATQKEVESKRLQIDATVAAANTKRLEADETIRLAEKELLEKAASGSLTLEKQSELQTRINNARAKQIEASASDEVVRGIENEIAALQKVAGAATSASNATRDYIQALGGLASAEYAKARNSTVASGPAAGSLGARLAATPKGGFTGRTENFQAPPPPDSSGDWQWVPLNTGHESDLGRGNWVLTRAGGERRLKADQEEFQKKFGASKGGQNVSTSGDRGALLSAAAQDAQVEREALAAGNPAAANLIGAQSRALQQSADYQTASDGSNPEAAKVVTVNLNFGGKSYSVKTASQSSADALIAALQEAAKQAGGG